MTRVVVEASLQVRLPQVASSFEFCDESGRTLGYFVPAPDSLRSLYDWAQTQFTDEEIERARRESWRAIQLAPPPEVYWREGWEYAAGALDANSVAISKAIGSVYGPDAEKAFLPLWRRHIGMVVDYTIGKATGDRAKQDRAVNELIGYTQDFGAFLSGANPNLPKAVVADLVKHHVVTLKDVIDAQAANDQSRAFTAERTGAGHMQMLADPLAEAIVRQLPDPF